LLGHVCKVVRRFFFHSSPIDFQTSGKALLQSTALLADRKLCLYALQVKPPVGLSTPRIFKSLDLERRSQADPLQLLQGMANVRTSLFEQGTCAVKIAALLPCCWEDCKRGLVQPWCTCPMPYMYVVLYKGTHTVLHLAALLVSPLFLPVLCTTGPPSLPLPCCTYADTYVVVPSRPMNSLTAAWSQRQNL
jgi:hypothetical protein